MLVKPCLFAKSKGFSHSGSNTPDDIGWYCENSGDSKIAAKDFTFSMNNPLYIKISSNNCRTHPVGQKKPNELGLYDMTGNVGEWCADGYGDSPPVGVDPTGKLSGTDRVCRGGDWCDQAKDCQLTCRRMGAPDQRLMPGHRGCRLGFRLALDAPFPQ